MFPFYTLLEEQKTKGFFFRGYKMGKYLLLMHWDCVHKLNENFYDHSH